MSEHAPMQRRRPARRPVPSPDACASMWSDCDRPSWGSAAPATFWLALEQPGPWGRLVFRQSRLDPAIAVPLQEACSQSGGRALLIRQVGAHRAIDDDHPRRLFLAGGMRAGRPWLLTGDVEDPRDLLALPFADLAQAGPEAATGVLPHLRPQDDSVLLVCTNAKRDACCALLGRPLALDADRARPGRVWECTHTGGHRFAPTAVLLPTGATLGRLDLDLAVAAIDSPVPHLPAALLDPRHHRGLPHVPQVEQAAEAHVRAELGETDCTALSTTVLRPLAEHSPALVEVTHARSDRRWTLQVAKRADDEPRRRSSCTTAPVPTVAWDTVEV